MTGEVSKVDQTLLGKTGVTFSQGSVAKAEKKIIIPIGQQYSTNQKTVDGAEITLSNGATMTLPLSQKQGAKVSVDGDKMFFEKLSDVEIRGKDYCHEEINIIGCKNAKIWVTDGKNALPDDVTITDHTDGTKSKNVTVFQDKYDSVNIYPINMYNRADGLTVYNSEDELYFNNDDQKEVNTWVDKDGTKQVYEYKKGIRTTTFTDGTKSVDYEKKGIRTFTNKNGDVKYKKVDKTVENSDGSEDIYYVDITKEEFDAILNPQKATNKPEKTKGTGEYRCAEVADPVKHKVYYDPEGNEISAFEFQMKTQGFLY